MENKINKRKKRKQRDYNIGFKLGVVGQVEKGKMTYRQAQARYGIEGRSTVLKWLRKHGSLDWSNPKVHFMSSPEKKPAKITSQAQIKLTKRCQPISGRHKIMFFNDDALLRSEAGKCA